MVALLLAASLAVASSLVGTKLLMDWLVARKVGQPIHEDVPDGHTVKAGTPTMGGLAIVGAAIVGYLAAHVRSHLVFTRTGVLVMACIAGAGTVGLIDREVVKIFLKWGFNWGGYWHYTDPMHFELARIVAVK